MIPDVLIEKDSHPIQRPIQPLSTPNVEDALLLDHFDWNTRFSQGSGKHPRLSDWHELVIGRVNEQERWIVWRRIGARRRSSV
jgi:hypothetical protein